MLQFKWDITDLPHLPEYIKERPPVNNTDTIKEASGSIEDRIAKVLIPQGY